MKPKVLVGMSGGIDSSVCAYLLKKRGFEPIGVNFKYWVDPHRATAKKQDNKCCSLEDIVVAREVCSFLGIDFHVVSVSDLFKEQVVDYFIEKSEEGLTPNPCVECNKNIKFGAFLKLADKLGVSYISSGHYAQTLSVIPKNSGMMLLASNNKEKDQSYFLHKLSNEELSRILFPIGHFSSKDEVRKIAIDAGLPLPQSKKESQGLCFYKEKQPTEFLKRYTKGLFQKGSIKTLDEEVIGEHEGLGSYTIGQRKGIDIGGQNEPFFVIKKDGKTNTLYVGKEGDLFQNEIVIKDPYFRSVKLNKKLNIRIRNHHSGEIGKLKKIDENTYKFTLDNPVRAITPGQFAVIYDENEVLGGGIIQ